MVLRESQLGLVRDDADFSKELALDSASVVEPVEDRYEILTAKRRLNEYHANRQVFHLTTTDGKKLDVIFQVSNGGVAFRYHFPETGMEKRSINNELSSFHFPLEAKAFLQPMSVAKTGFELTNPAYEEYVSRDIPVGTPSRLGAGWVYAALFQAGENWVLLSEGSLARGDCAGRLRSESPDRRIHARN